MGVDNHYRCLESMYAAAPINSFFKPTMTVSEGEAVIEMHLTENFHHPAGAAHGAVYFKMLDDAAFFAASSLEREMFVLTSTFTTSFSRPVSDGKMKAIGRVVDRSGSRYHAEAIVYDDNDCEVGRGNGVFVRSKKPLIQINSYTAKST